MKKTLITAAALITAASQAVAGAVVYVAPDVTTIDAPMNPGSGSWLIPLAIIAILALTLTNDNCRLRPAQSAFEPMCK